MKSCPKAASACKIRPYVHCLRKDLLWQCAESSPNRPYTSRLSLCSVLEGWHCQRQPSKKWNPCLHKEHGVRNYVIRNYVYISLSPSLFPSLPPSVLTDRRRRTHAYRVHTYSRVYASVCIYTHKVGLFAFSFFSALSKPTASNSSTMAASIVLCEEKGKSEKSQKAHDSSWDSSKNL